MKKIGLSFIALAFALVVPVSSANAGGDGQWTMVGDSKLTYSTYGFYDTDNIRSDGGSFMVSACRADGYGYRIELWEHDPGSGNDDYVGSTYLSGTGDKGVFNHLNRFVDGSNNWAEFYAKSYDPDSNQDEICFFD